MINKEIYLPAFIGLIMVALFLFAARTLNIVVIFIPGVILTYIIYLKTAYKQDLNPEVFLPLYLMALAVQFLHFLEEYLSQFYIDIPKLLGIPEFPLNDWIIFNMIAYAIFTLGGIIDL